MITNSKVSQPIPSLITPTLPCPLVSLFVGASGRTGPDRNRPLEVRGEELDIDKVSKMKVDGDSMCCEWIG